MCDEARKPLYNLYVDDSGTRHPDRALPTSRVGDWFGLGGFLIKEEDEELARAIHADFCDRWKITYPLHSIKIRHHSGDFKWLANLSQNKLRTFFNDLDKMMADVPVICHACVVDRPGYHDRYHELYAGQRWHLCKSAFTILAERVAKFAALQDRRVRILIEETDKHSDNRIRDYFREMRGRGMPFDQANSERYNPMASAELHNRLIDLKFKRKSSPMIQLADLLLYPLCRSPYDKLYGPLKTLQEHGKLITNHLAPDQQSHMGIKHYCFDK